MKKFLIFSFMISMISSCTDLEENPMDQLGPSDELTSDNDFELSSQAPIQPFSSEALYGRRLFVSLLLRSDMVSIGDQTTFPRRKEIDLFTTGAANEMVRDFFPQLLVAAGTANNAIQKFEIFEGTNENIEKFKGTALFFRAFASYHLVRCFGEVPYVKVNALEATDEEFAAASKKLSVPEVYENIIIDLQEAKELLPDTQRAPSLPSKGTAAGYLASVYLTLGEWQKAYDEAKFVIDNKGTFGYSLVPDFNDLWRASTQNAGLSEVLFEIDNRGADATSGSQTDYMAAVTGIRGNGTSAQEGWSVCVPSLAVFNSFDDRDYRKEVMFSTEMTDQNGVLVQWPDFENYPRSVSLPHINIYDKEPGVSGANGRDSDQNYATMRYAEVLLIAAEALNELGGDPSEAVGYVNQIRARARNTPSGVSDFPADLNVMGQNELRDAIREERRIELAFQGKRWYDIIRWGIGNEVFGPNGFEQRGYTEPRDLLFPIPERSLQLSPNLEPQNPGY